MTKLQIEMAIAALILLIIIVACLKRNSISIKNSVAWFILPVAFLFIAIFPAPIIALSDLFGFETLSNFIFVIIIALLILVCFSLTISLSRQQVKITKLIQELSILKEKTNDQKSEKSNDLNSD